MDQKTEVLLETYHKEVKKLARGIYLRALSMKDELNFAKINPEDKLTILMHVVSLLTTEERKTENGQ
jgi:hypothetical protein